MPETVRAGTLTSDLLAQDDSATDRRRQDFASVEGFLQLLARAVRQHRTYPASSPLCVDAITACHKALAAGDGHVTFRVTPHEALVDDVGTGAGTLVEHELVRRLHRARVTALDIDRTATPRDLSRFCSDLIGAAEGGESTSLADVLADHGVDTIVPRTAYRPEVLNLGTPSQALCDLAAHERGREAMGASEGSTIHLYPRDKGWVRLDPSASLDAVSLAELSILADDPSRVAAMLLRLTDGDAGGSEPAQTPLEKKYSEVATLFASLDPAIGRLMFAKLARAVLDLEPARRRDLLRRTILPALLDGQVDGAVLNDFPDVDLVESLGLLLDLESARPEVVWTAVDRLQLPADRARAVAPLVEAEINKRVGDPSRETAAGPDSGTDCYVRDLVRVDASTGKTFADFTAFDLSIDDKTRDAIAHVPHEIDTTDVVGSQLRCLSSLVRHEPNPSVVEGFLWRASVLLAELERQARWHDVASCLAGFRLLGDSLVEHRPDVAAAIAAALGSFCTKDRAIRICEWYEKDGPQRAAAVALFGACGTSVVPACVALLDDRALQSKVRPAVQLMCDHAKLLAPALADQLGSASRGTARAIVRALGFAGRGCEAVIAGQFGSGDEQLEREALRALARIGSGKAAALIAQQVERGGARTRGAAEEALWHLPATEAQSQAKELLSRREFVLRSPQVAVRLLERVSVAETEDFATVLSTLASLRYRFWNPGLSRVGRAAHRLVRS